MIKKTTLHILNGQCMYDHYKKTHFLREEMMVPFNEAMCFGETSSDIFTQEFIEKRSKVHQVTLEQYINITLKPLKPLLSKDFSEIVLWFDGDMFCQINMLTILAWLDKNGHMNPITLHIVDHNFKPIEKYTLLAKGYDEIFTQVMIHKTLPESLHPAPLKNGVELYLTYQNKDSNLMLYIQQHQHLPENELLSSLFEHFKEYGLGDVQFLELIKNQRKSIDGQPV